MEAEIEKMNRFTADVLGIHNEIKIPEMDVRGYAKYVLKNGTADEKRELLGCLKSKLILTNGRLGLTE